MLDRDDPYGADVLAGDWRKAGAKPIPKVPVARDLVVEEPASGWVGAVVGVQGGVVELEDRRGKVRAFPLGTGFMIDGRPVELVPPTAAVRRPARTASGSVAAPTSRARVARASRILVEGRHDAELVEKVWGSDLRAEGVVVEFLGGVDDLVAALAEYAPTREKRIGVLVDHLVPGSKEHRIATAAERAYPGVVRVVGHPYIDVWQSVKPERLGRDAWPVIPRGTEWKHGVCEAFGWPHDDQADIARAWQRILSRVDHLGHLEPELLGRVEELIDFVTVDPPA